MRPVVDPGSECAAGRRQAAADWGRRKERKRRRGKNARQEAGHSQHEGIKESGRGMYRSRREGKEKETMLTAFIAAFVRWLVILRVHLSTTQPCLLLHYTAVGPIFGINNPRR